MPLHFFKSLSIREKWSSVKFHYLRETILNSNSPSRIYKSAFTNVEVIIVGFVFYNNRLIQFE